MHGIAVKQRGPTTFDLWMGQFARTWQLQGHFQQNDL